MVSMFIGEAKRSTVGSAAIYAGATNTFSCLTKAWVRIQIIWIQDLDRISRAVHAVMSAESGRDRAVGYVA